jgi:hypothetical protein
MNKFTAIEWQSFSLKKDIEVIVKKLKDNRVIQISLLFKIALVTLGAALPKIFDVAKQQCFWVILSVLSITPFIYLGFKWIRRKCKENERSYDQMDPRDFIDAFDNEIVYYILTSESYCTMLTEALSNNNTSTNVVYFYYIQASYYFQKTITDLSSINNIVNEVLSSKEDDIIAKKLISLPRYKNIKSSITTIYEYLESNKNTIKTFEGSEPVIKLKIQRQIGRN